MVVKSSESGPLEVLVDPGVLEAIRDQACAEYPEECCGVLMGVKGGLRIVIEDACRSNNVWTSDRTRGYQLDPRLLLDVLLPPLRDSLQPVGFYHSHTRGDASPSAIDRARAWPEYVYLIQSVGDIDDCRAWFKPAGVSRLQSVILTPRRRLDRADQPVAAGSR